MTDRNGADEARAGVRENDRFLERVRREPPRLVRAMVGAHAAFTLSDDTAEALADVARRHRAGVHIHVAEDAVDARKDGGSTVAWLRARGLLDERSLLAHCVHVDDADVARIRDAGALGRAQPAQQRQQRRRLRASEPLRRSAAARHRRHRRRHARRGAGRLLRRARPRRRARRRRGAGAQPRASPAARFGVEELGDSVTLDYRSPTPLDDGNFGGHLLFGLGGARVRDVVVDGHVVVRDGVCVNVDEERIYARAREIAARLWSRL